MKKRILLALCAMMLFAACGDKEVNPFLPKPSYNVLVNSSGHNLDIIFSTEDTVLQYHLFDGARVVFSDDETRHLLVPPGTDTALLMKYIPNAQVKRTATLTFDETYTHSSSVIYHYDSVGRICRDEYLPEIWNFFDYSNTLGIHNHNDEEASYHDLIVTSAYYEQAVAQYGN